ncbi:MAG TPA: YidC/Oxa1 family membrane protein insertase, partial [Candidatus Paceibacterota bacterium]|nr:YidC/Oxa1 family membrane protein insertase [Candidatus Paceibacterota bacterium]
MMSFFHTVLYTPIYNLLIFLTDIVPAGDIGIAVIVATIIVKLVILPLSLSAARTQKVLKEIEPKLKELREKYKDDKEKQAREMFALYKENHINPFAGLATLFIQLPILLTLFWVFQSKTLSTVDTSLLYPFVPVPEAISPFFLGTFEIAGASILLALIAGILQFVQGKFSFTIPPKSTKTGPESIQQDFGRAMMMQMLYVL